MMLEHPLNDVALRTQMVEIASKMYTRGYISGVAGNLSARLGGGDILVTPAGVCKADLTPDMLLVVDPKGKVLDSPFGMRPTSEQPMHLEVYRQRQDVGAVVHAHPVAAVALSLVGISLEEPYIPEAVVLLGPVPTTVYATPSSDENREAIQNLISDHDALILAHHGTLTVGDDLEQAYMRLETLEHVAQIIALARQIGTPENLSGEAVAKLERMRQAIS